MPTISPQEFDDEIHFVWDDAVKRSFYDKIPHTFRKAAEKLEFAEIVTSHLKFGYSLLGKQAVTDELIPKQKLEDILTSLAEIDELRIFIGAGETPSFGGLHDIRETLHKIEIEGSTIYQDDGLPLLESIRMMRAIREFFARRTKDAPTLWKTAIHLFEDKMIELALDSVFDEVGNIKDSASAELRSIRREIIATAERLRSKLNALVKQYSAEDYLQEDLVTQRDGRFVVPVKSEHKRQVSGMIHSVSQTGQTIYIEPQETNDLNNELRSLEFAEMREIDQILRKLTERMRDSVPAIRFSLKAVSHLEAVNSKTRYAMRCSCYSPNVKSFPKIDDREFILRGARHPFLIERLGEKNTVPFDLAMSKENRTLVLTGPNAGGKTVLLKSTGLLSLMALSGLPIPAAPDSIVPTFDSLAVDIGDAQSIADDLSTFSSHVKTLKDIIERSDEHTLTLLDEIGSGTAPEEGGALAESILEHLTNQGGFTISTTHYGRLAAFAETTEGAVNGSMEFNEEDLRPTYRFRLNIPGSSHAFDIAERYEMSKKIISRARVLAGAKTTRLDELIESLNRKEQEVAAKKAESERELGKARVERMEYERLHDEVTLQRKDILAKASKEADALLSNVNTYVERTIREAREAAEIEKAPIKEEKAPKLAQLRAKQKEELKELQEKVSEHYEATNKEEVENELPIEAGSKVRLLSNPGQVGDVLSLKGNDVEVIFGSMTMRMKTDKLQRISNAEARKETRSTMRTSTYFDEQFSPRIDLRGLYGDEGVLKVEKFLSDAASHSVDKVEIIHGMGTGALGKKIQQSLKAHPLVKSFRYGEPNEGGAGVTVVEIN
jgi:DNA mismatch repair protein MutS2